MLRQAQHERRGMVHHLTCHPDTPAKAVSGVEVQWLANDADEALLAFTVTGAEALVLPEWATPVRTDDLWKATCFELFWQAADADNYVELNFSPSTRWAAYAFDGYRAGMRNQPMAVDPHIETKSRGDRVVCEIDIDFSAFSGEAAHVGLSAVIEEVDGTKSYWALAHADGPPDFHDPACFVLDLPAVG